jgi:hypothetical protein
MKEQKSLVQCIFVENTLRISKMKKSLILLFTNTLLLIISFSLNAAVVDSSYYGFTIRQEYSINNVPDSAFHNLVYYIGKWWDSEHTYSGKASNLWIDAVAGGCFCEKLPNGGSVRHMTVVFAQPGKTLRMEGGLGPLQSMAVNAVMTFTFSGEGSGTKVTISYVVGGYVPGGLQKMSVLVDRVLADQMKRFQNFC